MMSFTELPVEIWAHIASFDAVALGKLLITIKGLYEYLRDYRFLDGPFMRNFVRTVYEYGEDGPKPVDVYAGHPDRPWPHVVAHSGTPADNQLVRFDGATGTIQPSGATISDDGNLVTYELQSIEPMSHHFSDQGPRFELYGSMGSEIITFTDRGYRLMFSGSYCEISRDFGVIQIIFSPLRGVNIRVDDYLSVIFTYTSLTKKGRDLRVTGAHVLFVYRHVDGWDTGIDPSNDNNLDGDIFMKVGERVVHATPHVVNMFKPGDVYQSVFKDRKRVERFHYNNEIYHNKLSVTYTRRKHTSILVSEPLFYMHLHREKKITDLLAVNRRMRGTARMRGLTLHFIDGTLVKQE